MYVRLVLVSKTSSSPYLRRMSTKSLSSSFVRKSFIDYFVKDHKHTFVPSCPIRPLSDPTVPFVNAGMIQFKTLLQGKTSPPWLRVANSQKCARVGGHHNDLDTVGKDGYHHTFFEMLGNWSFGDYFKEDACSMAWQLLTGPYGLDPGRLYVTYFGGDEGLGLEPDLECVDIWRKIGVQTNHILPFGVKENFWEMGLSGPCGPCTEIHVDHIPGRQIGYSRVNAGFPDVTELWNIVFVQYNRNLDGSITKLQGCHVDTGMGLERLVALLNGCSSNYDTDLFRPVIQAIHRITGVPAYSGSFNSSIEAQNWDEAYRILSDHARLFTVALADGVLPHHQHKLRWVLRRAFRVARSMNSDHRLLVELSNYVAESLGDIYPEIGRNLKQVQWLIGHEAEMYDSLLGARTKKWNELAAGEPLLEELLLVGSHPEKLADAFERVKEFKGQELPASVGFLLYESFGLKEEMIEMLSNIAGAHFNAEMLRRELENIKLKSKLETARMCTNDLADSLSRSNIPPTNDSFIHKYQRLQEGNYEFPIIKAKILAVAVAGDLTETVEDGAECSIIMDHTNMYYTAGGQASDQGYIVKTSGESQGSLHVTSVQKIGGYVIHHGTVRGRLKAEDEVEVKLIRPRRMALMRNHTAAHLVSGELNRILTVTNQEGCFIDDSLMKISFSLYGENFDSTSVEKIEKSIKKVIEGCFPVERRTVTSWEMVNMPKLTLIPNETYPVDNVHIIDITNGNDVLSREACCGTHVQNTSDLGSFCITQLVQHKKKPAIIAVTGMDANRAIQYGDSLLSQATALHKSVIEFDVTSDVQKDIGKLLNLYQLYDMLYKEKEKKLTYIPYLPRHSIANSMEDVSRILDHKARLLSDVEVRTAAEGKRCLVHNLQSTQYLDSVLLHKLTRTVKDLPVMLFAPNLRKRELKARCCVPVALATQDFNAEVWMKKVAQELNVPVNWGKQEGDRLLAFNWPSVKFNLKEVGVAVKVASKVAAECLSIDK